MPNFPSAGAGFAQGFASTYAPRQQAAAQKEIVQMQVDAQTQAAQAKALRETIDGLKDSTFETLKELGTNARDLASSGRAGEEDFNGFIQAGNASIAATASFYQQLAAQTVAAGGDPSQIQAELNAFIEQTRNLIPAAIDAGRMMAPSGTQEGEIDIAELTAQLGRPPTMEERQRRAGVAPPASLVNINNSQETEFAKTVGEEMGTMVAEIMRSASQGGFQIAQLDRLEAALDSGRFTPGSFGQFRSNLANFADFIGAGEGVKAMVGDAATADTIDAAANQMAIGMAEKMSRVTNMSLTFIRDSLPGLMRTEEGNRIIMEMMRRTVRREQQIADIAQDFVQEGTLFPKDKPSFNDRISALDESDPIVGEDLRNRITQGSRQSPSSFAELFGDTVPEGLPDGTRKVGVQTDAETGQMYTIYQAPDGTRYKFVPDAPEGE